MATNRSNTKFYIIGGSWFVGLTIFSVLTKLDRSNPLFVGLLVIPVAVYLASVIYFEHYDFRPNQRQQISIWGLAIMVRLVVLLFPIGLSDDIYRYLWDGHIQHQGISPYRFSPNAVELQQYRTSWWDRINNKEIPTPYPPFSQAIFFLSTLLTSNLDLQIITIRIIVTAFDLGTWLVLQKICDLLDLPKRRAIYYGWSPLAIFEFAGNGHIDSVAVFLMVSAIYCIVGANSKSKKHLFSPILIAGSILTKYFPIVVLPFLALKWTRKELLLFLVSFIGITFPYYVPGINPITPEGQIIFVQYFRFNESVFRVVTYLLSLTLSRAEFWTRVIYVIVMVFFSLFQLTKFWNERTDRRIIASCSSILFVALLLGPDVQPWYCLWVLPLAVLIPDYAVILFSGLVLFSYQIYLEYDISGVWQESPWILLVQYVPLAILLVLSHRKALLRNQ